MRLTVTLADGTVHDVGTLGLRGTIDFERHFGIPASVLDPADPTPNRTEWTAFIIYKGLQKSGAIARSTSFDEALDVLDEAAVEQVTEPGDEGYEGDEVDPTNSAPGEVQPLVS